MRRPVQRLGQGMRADGTDESGHHPFHPPWLVGKLRGRLIQPLLLSPFDRYAAMLMETFRYGRGQCARQQGHGKCIGLTVNVRIRVRLRSWVMPTQNRADSMWRNAWRVYPVP